VHLKSLTLRGFKSFASATTLRFEPGVTAVVGPNGSGKSNVVDAIAWVLGEQGAKALRGGKMEDVIFAGTAGRPPLGRAEVTLTIDNTDNALPIDYTEVSITRRMFREGSSEYEINGEQVRLLDVQELLSDSGIGREMHVIVGQGQLDTVLNSRPEDRRGFIEEAAGVLKHRKRKEKALRKLDAMQANLTRVTDLTNELRRQLKPLGKQAEIARRAAGVQAELRDSRLRLLADDLMTLRSELDKEVADEEAIGRRPRAGDLVPALRAGGAAAGDGVPGRRARPAPLGRGRGAGAHGARAGADGGRGRRDPGRGGAAPGRARRRQGGADRHRLPPPGAGAPGSAGRARAGRRRARRRRPPRGAGEAGRPGQRAAHPGFGRR
jgi:predicted ATPase